MSRLSNTSVVATALAMVGAAALAQKAYTACADRWEIAAPSWAAARSWRIRRRWYGTGRRVFVDGQPGRVLTWVADPGHGGGVCLLVLLEGEETADWLPLAEAFPDPDMALVPCLTGGRS